jgi:hypothetical protein
MVRRAVLALGAYAAVCLSASPASSGDSYPPPPSVRAIDLKDISLRCEPVAGGTPWISDIARDYRISPGNSAVNGEILRISRIDENRENSLLGFGAKARKLAWNRPADASVPVAHYVLDLATNGIAVSFDDGEYDGRKLAGTELQLRCTRRLLKYS